MKTRKTIYIAHVVLTVAAAASTLGYTAYAMQPGALVGQQPQQTRPAPTTPQMPDQAMPDQNGAKSSVFTGTIVKDGSDFVLRASSGDVYRLDATTKAQPFEGKSVKVTGKLEESAKLIHVEDIVEVSA